MTNTESPWLDEMISRLGVQEIQGKNKHNPVIIGWFHEIGHPEVNNDETSWCAVAAGSCLKSCGYPTTPTTVNMLARSYVTYGTKSLPKRGALAIWPRGNSKWQGHINIIEDTRTHNGKLQVRCIGGNQSGLKGGDAVTRSDWRDADQALTFRWPVKSTVKDLRKAGSTEVKNADMLEAASATTTVIGSAAAIAKEALVPVDGMTAIPSLIPEGAADHVGAAQLVLEALNGLANVVKSSPWLAVAAFISLAGFWLARLWKAGRLNRHILGLPLSSEAEWGGDA